MNRIGAAIDALTIDRARFEREHDRIVRGVLSAAVGATRSTAKATERELEALTKDAMPGRGWRAWKSEAFPKEGIARDPTATIFLNGGERTRGLFEFYTKPGRIKGKSDQWLAIPTKAAGRRGRNRMLTPGEWERANGVRLRFVYRKGKPGLLVADMGTTNQRTGAYRQITRRRTMADERRGFMLGEQTVVIFVLVPFVNFKNSLSIEPKLNAAEGELVREFLRRVRATN